MLPPCGTTVDKIGNPVIILCVAVVDIELDRLSVCKVNNTSSIQTFEQHVRASAHYDSTKLSPPEIQHPIVESLLR